MEESNEVLAFWFGTQQDDAAVAAEKSDLWWGKDPDVDRLVCDRFGPLRGAAVRGELNDWTAEPRSRLALILLVDQFSRQLFRDSAEAFDHDGLARHWCIDGLEIGYDRRLRPIERVFFYLPLEHSESRDDQTRNVALFESLLAAVPPAEQTTFQSFLDFARRHRAIIERFGRFPHRNAVLGRPSTADEQVFLREPGSSF